MNYNVLYIKYIENNLKRPDEICQAWKYTGKTFFLLVGGRGWPLGQGYPIFSFR
jgi:hypothetical protein